MKLNPDIHTDGESPAKLSQKKEGEVTALADPLDVIPDDYQAPADHFFSHDLGLQQYKASEKFVDNL